MDRATQGTVMHRCGRRATAARRRAVAAPTPLRPPAARSVATAATNGQMLLRSQTSAESLLIILVLAWHGDLPFFVYYIFQINSTKFMLQRSYVGGEVTQLPEKEFKI